MDIFIVSGIIFFLIIIGFPLGLYFLIRWIREHNTVRLARKIYKEKIRIDNERERLI